MRGRFYLPILLLSTLYSSVGRADVSLSEGDIAADGPTPTLARRTWQQTHFVDAAAAPTRWQPNYPLLTVPQLTAWLLRNNGIPTFVGLQDYERPRAADDALASSSGSVKLRPTWPVLHYRDAEGDLSLTLSPGSPCTGACLKVAGSF